MGTLDVMKIELDGIGHILEDNHLSVPKYQRSYAWEEKHVTDLFKDISTAIQQTEKEYFLGSIVMTGDSKDNLEVVDGQQRLATTTMLIAAIRDYFFHTGDKDRASQITTRFLMDKDLWSQEIIPRLHLNEIDHNFFAKKVLTYPNDPGRNVSPDRDSHKRIKEATELAAKQVKRIIESTNDPANSLLAWIRYLIENTKVIYVTVPDYANAFTIFETLNDRGLALAISDLLKNYLFSRAQDRIDEVYQKWTSMIGVLEAVDNEEIVITYIRHLWSSKDGPTREKDLYDRIKLRITSKQVAVDFAEELYRDAKLYAAILNPSHEVWEQYGPTTRDHMATLNLLGMIQMRPLILSVLDTFPTEETQKSLRVMVSWAVRFLIVGSLGGGSLGDFYAQRATEVRNGTILTAKQLLEAMQTVVPNDKQFIASFENASVSRANFARYYLRVLERQARNDPQPALDVSSNQDYVTLEHILPQNPSNAWGFLDSETVRAYFNRIGNLALLQKKPNSDVGNLGFAEKQQVYTGSPFQLTSSLTQYSQWGPEEIETRQKWLADLAVKAWPNKLG